MTVKDFGALMREAYKPGSIIKLSDEPDNTGRVPREQCICSCGHHQDSHEDGWQSCCECDCPTHYDGPQPIIDPEAYRRVLAMFRKGGT